MLFFQIEKPFGHDLESSRELQRALDPNWREDEIFRVDHYLGKEVVNNLLVLRFGNEIFGAIWNARHIDNIEVSFSSKPDSQLLSWLQVSITEGKGAEGRGSYFNGVGAIRDVMQNRKSLFLFQSLHVSQSPQISRRYWHYLQWNDQNLFQRKICARKRFLVLLTLGMEPPLLI